MSFRFVFWEDSSQVNSFSDKLTQQAEAEFRNTHLAEFGEVAPQQPVQAPPKLADKAGQAALQNTVDAVSGLVQTVANNLNADSSPDKVSEIVQTATETLNNTKNNLAESSDSSAQAAPAKSVDQSNQTAQADALVKKIDEVGVSITAVSQTINENSNAASVSNPSADNQPNIALNDLMKKMQSFLTEVKSLVNSFMKIIRQPQMQYYYGAEDVIQDSFKHDSITNENKKKQEQFEEIVLLKIIETENNKAAKKKQNELEKILSKRIEETRNNAFFNK
jgi:hypothetical protein